MKDKDFVLTSIAIILTILICFGNLHALFSSPGSWINAGAAILVMGVIVIALHAILLLILKQSAIKLSLGYTIVIWVFTIFIYILPIVISHRNQLEYKKQAMMKLSAEKRISDGVATIDDFTYLCQKNDESILIYALRTGYNDIAIQVLNAVCDPKSDRIFGNYILRLSYVEKYGKDIARKKVLGLWLIEAAKNELCDGAELLLNAGADVNLMNDSDSPLIAAVRAGQIEMVRLFLKKGAEVNAINCYEYDALYYAIVNDQASIAELLIEYGANTERKYRESDDQPYEPLLFFALQRGYAETAEVLKRNTRK